MQRIATALCFIMLLAPAAFAQQAQTVPPQAAPPGGKPAPGTTTPAPTAPPTMPAPGQQTPRPGGSPAAVPAQGPPPAQAAQNIQLTVTISDSLGGGAQSRKSVTMLVVDGRSGQVRSAAGDYNINVDARPNAQRDGRIYLQLTVEYFPELSTQQLQQSGSSRSTRFSESLTVIVPDGKPVIASESSDPRSDRKVSLEVTATIVK